MTRRISALSLLVAVLALAFASVAQAAVLKKTGQSRADVLRYWTDARMRDAIPAERAARGNAGKPSGGTTTTYAYTALAPPTTDYTSFPTNTNGKVFFTKGRTNYVCSGTALASANDSVVWTAGHCVNSGPGKFHTNWKFVPAYLNGAKPYGEFTATDLASTDEWIASGDFRYDLGAAVVGTSSTTGKKLEVALGGGRTLDTTATVFASYTLYGYPAAKPFNGQTLRGCAAPFGLRDPNSAAPAPIGVGCDMTGGSSGGAWLDGDGEVASVNSFGYQTLRNVMFGPLQGSVASELFVAAQAR